MRLATLFPVILVAACAGETPPHATPAASHSAASSDIDPSGRPYDGPSGPPVSNPPADNNGSRLACHPQGQGIVCGRSDPSGS